MDDRKLLELAAKATGIKLNIEDDDQGAFDCWIVGTRSTWAPLTDDGDALRLAVKLGICIQTEWRKGFVSAGSISTVLLDEDDALSATRRAIVRAAAAIGKTMP